MRLIMKQQAPHYGSPSDVSNFKFLLLLEDYMKLELSEEDQLASSTEKLSFNDFMAIDLPNLSGINLYGWIDLASKFLKREDKLAKEDQCSLYAKLGEAHYIMGEWEKAVKNFNLSEKLAESEDGNDELLRLRGMRSDAIDKLYSKNTKIEPKKQAPSSEHLEKIKTSSSSQEIDNELHRFLSVPLPYINNMWSSSGENREKLRSNIKVFSVQLPYTNDMWSSSNKEEEKLIKEKLISNMEKMIEFALQIMKDPKFQESDEHWMYKKNEFYLRLGKIYFLIDDYCNAIKYFKMNTKLFGEDGEPRDGQKFDTYEEKQVMSIYESVSKNKTNEQMTKGEKSSYEKDLDDLKKLEDTVKFLQNYNSNCRMH